ncbi:hypothetical protein QTP70_016963 [Hemibagrus guttatus]|uniref:ribonuclease H n=1 Tax=Hemibagrus guttatus TaxID=175788 RepID=A0AAE0R838_9TELE|nr:hypothetical protein QTP70_016963 [Hemibagrus guttatus]
MSPSVPVLPMPDTSVKSPVTAMDTMIQHEYRDLCGVFIKEKAAKLPLHCPWDCTINLLPNAIPPKCKVYPLSLPETKAMEENIKEIKESDDIFRDAINQYVITYIDDILIYSATYVEHVCHIRNVLTRLLQHQLYVKSEKCEFHKDSITFLGYVISQKRVEMDTSKVRTVMDWPELTTVKELQQFLGFANFYQRFIWNYSNIASPLSSLL